MLVDKEVHGVEQSILDRLQEARKQNRMVERDIADWLYARLLASNGGTSG